LAFPVDTELEGSFPRDLDDRDRVLLPQAFRMALQRVSLDRPLVMTMSPTLPCITVFVEQTWSALISDARDRVQALDPVGLDDDVRIKWMVGNCQRETFDGAQRLHLPKALKALAGIDRKVLAVGLQWKVELWNPDSWRALGEEVRSTRQAATRNTKG
jgi:DNA-binding transcriptional regulator/RsmH inhibitor MraZ